MTAADLTYVDLELPQASIVRSIKAVCAALPPAQTASNTPSDTNNAGSSSDWSLQKDAKLAITKAATVFISYLTAAAIDIAASGVTGTSATFKYYIYIIQYIFFC